MAFSLVDVHTVEVMCMHTYIYIRTLLTHVHMYIKSVKTPAAAAYRTLVGFLECTWILVHTLSAAAAAAAAVDDDDAMRVTRCHLLHIIQRGRAGFGVVLYRPESISGLRTVLRRRVCIIN